MPELTPTSEGTETRLLEGSGETFSILTSVVEKFIGAWEAAKTPPEIEPFLPPQGRVRRLLLAELIKVDLEYRFRDNREPQPLSHYVKRFPELRDPWVPVDLIYEEFHLRKQAGLVINPQEYLAAYPAQAEQLRAWLGLGEDYRSTRLVDRTLSGGLEAINVGDRIQDLDLLVELGRGAFARVFLARQSTMQRLLALKVSADKGDEPKTLAHLDHDYIVRVYDVLTVQDGLRLLLMQYVPGGTLEAVVDRASRLSPLERTGRLVCDTVDTALEAHGESRPTVAVSREVLAKMSWPDTVAWLGVRIATALDVAHRNGVLHRDVKPANVLLAADATPKLADFNISFSEQVQGSTPAAWFGGSLGYMSPEQLEACGGVNGRAADDLDARCDLYSLGVLLWELLTTERPLEVEVIDGGWGANLRARIDRRRAGLSPADFARLPPDCSPALRRVLARCLEPRPAQRWPSAADLARQLEMCLDPHMRSLTDPGPRSWIPWLRRNLAWLVVMINLLPNIVSAVANYQYNRWRIVEFLHNAVDRFDTIQGIINGIAFPTGIGLMAWLAWTVQRSLKPPDASAESRLKCLRLGERCALVCLVLWIIAGVAYPLAMQAVQVSLPPWVYGQFFISLFFSGLIAVAYPYLGTTFLCLRAGYPALIASGQTGAQDSAELERIERISGWALFVAGTVPLVAVLALSAVPMGDSGDALLTANDLWLLRALSVTGLLGLGLAWKMAQWLREDLAALRRVVKA